MVAEMRKRLSRSRPALALFAILALVLLAILTLLTKRSALPMHTDTSVTVDFATQLGTPTYRASGFIYGLSEDGTQPPQSFVSDIKTQFFRAGGAQLDCPDGGYVNGKYARRWNSVVAYHQQAKAVGGKLILLPHDLWGADAVCNVPRWPGDNGNWTEFTNFMTQVINDAKANGMSGSNVQWDIWNEPDLVTPVQFWGRDQTQYLEMWKRAYQQIRAAIPGAVIVGPSTSGQPSPSWTWFTTYLDYIKQNNVIPDIISWHELNPENDPVTSKNNLVGMVSARGLSVQGYQVNEYGAPSEQGPGDSAWFIARLERDGMDGARANWGMHGGLYDGMGGLVVNSGGYKPLGSWWVYKRYADMTGTHISVTGSETIDGVAAADSDTQKAIILLGSRGTTGSAAVNIRNMASYLIQTGQVRVVVEEMPQTDGAPVMAPTVIQDQMYTLSSNQINITLPWSNADDAYAITLTPR